MPAVPRTSRRGTRGTRSCCAASPRAAPSAGSPCAARARTPAEGGRGRHGSGARMRVAWAVRGSGWWRWRWCGRERLLRHPQRLAVPAQPVEGNARTAHDLGEQPRLLGRRLHGALQVAVGRLGKRLHKVHPHRVVQLGVLHSQRAQLGAHPGARRPLLGLVPCPAARTAAAAQRLVALRRRQRPGRRLARAGGGRASRQLAQLPEAALLVGCRVLWRDLVPATAERHILQLLFVLQLLAEQVLNVSQVHSSPGQLRAAGCG